MVRKTCAFLILIFAVILTTAYMSAVDEDPYLKQLKKLSADSASAVENHNTGAVYYNAKDYGEAYGRFLKAFVSEDDTKNESDEILASLGDALYQLGYLEDALKAYEGALNRNNLNQRARENYGITYERLMRHRNKNENEDKNESEQQENENGDGSGDNNSGENTGNEGNQDENSLNGGQTDQQEEAGSMDDLEKFLRNNSPEDSGSLAENTLNEGEGGVEQGEKGENEVLP